MPAPQDWPRLLSRPNRLTRKSEFDRLFAEGQALHDPLCSLRAAPNMLSVTRFGFICGKRVGGAVLRNRIRRRLRHQARRLLADLPSGWDILIVVRPKAALATSDELSAALMGLLRRRGLIGGENEK
ncbi:MAG: ribonuclease P protein component [Chloroflexota bacterium]|nr:ribonuclease P protein component [Chloroflexota bacterium]